MTVTASWCLLGSWHLTLGSELLRWLQKVSLIRGQVSWPHRAPVHLGSKHLHLAFAPVKAYVSRGQLWRKARKGTLVEQTLLISYNPPTAAPIQFSWPTHTQGQMGKGKVTRPVFLGPVRASLTLNKGISGQLPWTDQPYPLTTLIVLVVTKFSSETESYSL